MLTADARHRARHPTASACPDIPATRTGIACRRAQHPVASASADASPRPPTQSTSWRARPRRCGKDLDHGGGWSWAGDVPPDVPATQSRAGGGPISLRLRRAQLAAQSHSAYAGSAEARHPPGRRPPPARLHAVATLDVLSRVNGDSAAARAASKSHLTGGGGRRQHGGRTPSRVYATARAAVCRCHARRLGRADGDSAVAFPPTPTGVGRRTHVQTRAHSRGR